MTATVVGGLDAPWWRRQVSVVGTSVWFAPPCGAGLRRLGSPSATYVSTSRHLQVAPLLGRLRHITLAHNTGYPRYAQRRSSTRSKWYWTKVISRRATTVRSEIICASQIKRTVALENSTCTKISLTMTAVSHLSINLVVSSRKGLCDIWPYYISCDPIE